MMIMKAKGQCVRKRGKLLVKKLFKDKVTGILKEHALVLVSFVFNYNFTCQFSHKTGCIIRIA